MLRINAMSSILICISKHLTLIPLICERKLDELSLVSLLNLEYVSFSFHP